LNSPRTLPTHIQRISERVRMAKELEIARSVQMSLLPREQPRLQGYDIAGICIPAEEVGETTSISSGWAATSWGLPWATFRARECPPQST